MVVFGCTVRAASAKDTQGHLKGGGAQGAQTSAFAISAVSPEVDGVAPLDVGPLAGAVLAVAEALASQPTVLAARGGQPSSLAALVGVLADPVDPGVVPDRLVEGVHQDHLVILLAPVLR